MKQRIAAILLSLTMTLSLAACNSGPDLAPEIDRLTSELSEANECISALEAQLDTARSEAEEAQRAETERLAAEIAELEAANEALREQIEADAEQAAQDTLDDTAPDDKVLVDVSGQSSQASTPPAPSAAPSSPASSAPQSSAPSGNSGAGNGPAVTTDGNRTIISFGGGSSSAAEEERISAAVKKEILDYAKSYAEEIGLIWAGKPLTGFDPATNLYPDDDIADTKAWIEKKLDQYKELGYMQTYVEVIYHNNSDKLQFYRG